MQVDYLALSVDALATQAVITADAEQAYYNDNTDRFTQPGSRSASHILIGVPADAAEEAAKAKAREERLAMFKMPDEDEDDDAKDGGDGASDDGDAPKSDGDAPKKDDDGGGDDDGDDDGDGKEPALL